MRSPQRGGDVGDREVGARAQAADRGLVGQPRLARAVEAQVAAAGGDEGGAGLELVAEGGLADVQAATCGPGAPPASR